MESCAETKCESAGAACGEAPGAALCSALQISPLSQVRLWQAPSFEEQSLTDTQQLHNGLGDPGPGSSGAFATEGKTSLNAAVVSLSLLRGGKAEAALLGHSWIMPRLCLWD